MKTKIETKANEISDEQALKHKNFDEVLKKAALAKSAKLKWKWGAGGFIFFAAVFVGLIYFQEDKPAVIKPMISTQASAVKESANVEPHSKGSEMLVLPSKVRAKSMKQQPKDSVTNTKTMKEEIATAIPPRAILNLCGIEENGAVRKTQLVIGGRLNVFFPELEKSGRILYFEIHHNGEIMTSTSGNLSPAMRKYIIDLKDGADLQLSNIQYYVPQSKIQSIPSFKVKVVDNGEMRSYGF